MARASFETAARGVTSIGAALARPARRRVLLTGFDPFVHGGAPGHGVWNPSGAAVLALAGQQHGDTVFAGLVLPVSWDAFDGGLVERWVTPWLDAVDLVITVSMGREPALGPARAERYCVGVRRTGVLQIHATVPAEVRPDRWEPIPPAPGGHLGPPLIETRACLDICAGVTIGRDVAVIEAGEEQVLTDPVALRALAAAAWAGGTTLHLPDGRRVALRRGPGGSYLSNEVAYRVQRAIGQRPRPLSFHLHTPLGRPEDDLLTRRVLRDRLVTDIVRLSQSLL